MGRSKSQQRRACVHRSALPDARLVSNFSARGAWQGAMAVVIASMGRDSVEPPVSLTLGGFGFAQQRRTLPGGEVGRVGVVAEVFGLLAPSAGAGKATGINRALKVELASHGKLLNGERPARRLPAGWMERKAKHHAPSGCPEKAWR